MELWEWYCGKVLPTVCTQWRNQKVRASELMHSHVHFSDEVFVMVELRRNLSKWLSKPLTAEQCQTSHDNMVSDLKSKAPDHYLGRHLISRKYSSETDALSGDEIIHCKSRNIAETTALVSIQDDNEENENNQLIDKTSFWAQDNRVLEIYKDLDSLDQNLSVNYANTPERMEEVVFVTKLIKLLRIYPHCIDAKTHFQQKADEHWQATLREKYIEREKKIALMNKNVDYDELVDLDLEMDDDDDE
jgi:hypothetical protein